MTSMIDALKRYGLFLMLLSFAILLTFILFLFFSQKQDKIPSKGVYVMNGQEDVYFSS